MSDISRRTVLRVGTAVAASGGVGVWLAGCEPSEPSESDPRQEASKNDPTPGKREEKTTENILGTAMKIHYLEIVTSDVEALCGQYAKIHGAEFGEPVASFGGSRTAKLHDGSLIGIRAPLHGGEKPVVRPYVLVDDIRATVASAVEAGGETMVPPMEIPEQGTFAIVMLGGIECGFWQI